MRRIGFVVVTMVAAAALFGACAETPDAKRTRHLSRGDDYFGQGKFREAVIEYQNVLRFDATNPRAIERMGVSYHNLGDLRHAFPFLKKAREANPDDMGIAMKLSAIYLVAGRLDDARELAELVLDKDPNTLEALQVMAVSARTQSEIEAAAAGFEAARPALESKAPYHISLAELSMKARNLERAEQHLKAALERDAKSVQAHLMLANLYRAKGDRDGTLHELKTAVDIEPAGGARMRLVDFYAGANNYFAAREVLATVKEGDGDYLPARRRLAELAFLEGNADESLAVLNELFKKAKDDVEGHVIRGRVYLTKRQTTEAIQDFQNALRIDSKMVQARYWLAVAYHQTGNVQQARVELAQAVELAPRATDAVLLLGQINLETGNAAATIAAMEKLVGEQPRLPQAYLLLGMAQLSVRKPADALQTFRKMEAAVAKDVRAVYLAGLSLQALGQKGEALREFERALSMKPTFIDPLTSLVAQAVADGKTDVALDRVRKQISAAGNSARLQFLLGSVHHVRKESALAEAAYTKALEMDQALVPAYVSLGQLYLQGQDEQRALARFEQALKVNPNDVVSRMMVAQIYLGRGDVAKAKASYESILAASPRFAPAANNMAWVLTQDGSDKERALQLAQIAKEGAPDDPYVSDTLGWILHLRGIHERAWALLRDSAVKLPRNPEVQYHAGVVARTLGQTEVAREHLQRAVTAGVDFAGKDMARKALAELK